MCTQYAFYIGDVSIPDIWCLWGILKAVPHRHQETSILSLVAGWNIYLAQQWLLDFRPEAPTHGQPHKCELTINTPTCCPGLLGLTFHQDLGDLRVAGAEGTVELEAVSVIQKGSPEREQHFLDTMRNSAVSLRSSSPRNISTMEPGAHTCTSPHKPAPFPPVSACLCSLMAYWKAYGLTFLCNRCCIWLSVITASITGFAGLCLSMT